MIRPDEIETQLLIIYNCQNLILTEKNYSTSNICVDFHK